MPFSSLGEPYAYYNSCHNQTWRCKTYIWTCAGVQPDQEYVLYLCGGHSREGDVESHIHDITNGRVMTVVIDPARGGYQHCIELEPVLAGIQLLIQNELCVAMIHTRPCSPWSGLRCLRPGPPMLFDLDNLYGIKDANGMYSQTTVDARLIGDAIASCIRTATSCNRTCLGEGPVGRGRDSPYAIKGQETHAGVWSYPPVASALVNGNQTEIIADLGKAGAKSPKTTAFFVTEDILPAAQLELGTLKMPDHSPQMESMVGADATGTYRSNATAFFSTETSRRVAKAILHAWLIARNATPGYGALPPDSVGGGVCNRLTKKCQISRKWSTPSQILRMTIINHSSKYRMRSRHLALAHGVNHPMQSTTRKAMS